VKVAAPNHANERWAWWAMLVALILPIRKFMARSS
jgi:hypothetical protein